MNTKAEAADKLDIVKWIAAVALIAVGIAGFYYFSEQSNLLRVVSLLAIVGVAGYIASTTAKGQETLRFFKETQKEVRHVVWPTYQETVQTTAIVFLMVLLVALFIWLLDTILMMIVRWLTGQGG